MSEYLPERDWKHLRAVHIVALDRYCRQVLDESTAIIGARDISNHERYLRLFRLLKDRDGTLARAFDDLRRSTAIQHLGALIRLHLLTEEELSGFSQETIESAGIFAR